MGLTIFSIGLVKKAVLADGIAAYATPVFEAAERGDALTFFDGWFGALSYTFQLYFDFSGYSDMAIGAALMFGIHLPLNFASPYKSLNIIDFWRRWHITLSRFLKDYLYIPLGGNKKGPKRRYANLLLTMLLGGLWHGAGWTFVVWGLLHGVYLIINQGWRYLYDKVGFSRRGSRFGAILSWAVTFFAVVVAWVFFRAESFDSAINILKAMAGWRGIVLPEAFAARLGGFWPFLESLGVTMKFGGGASFALNSAWIVSLGIVAFLFPNTQEFAGYRAASATGKVEEWSESAVVLSRVGWRPYWQWAVLTGALSAVGILALTSISEFLYFQF